MRHTKWCSHPVLRQVVMGYTSPSSLPGESRLGRGARGGCGLDPMSAQRPHPAFAVPPGPQENQLVFAAGSPYQAGRQAERFVSILAYYAVHLLAYSAVLKLASCVVLSLAYSALMIQATPSDTRIPFIRPEPVAALLAIPGLLWWSGIDGTPGGLAALLTVNASRRSDNVDLDQLEATLVTCEPTRLRTWAARGAAALLLFGPATLAAQPADDSQTPASSVPGAESPRIHSDGRVTFELNAPDARSIQVAGGDGLGKGPFPMTKGGDGTWSVTIPPPVPGFHYYWFVLDGVDVNDPTSLTYFGYGKETSGIEIPEPGADYYAMKNIPHGEVREKWYFSKTTGEWRRALVYTLPGYDSSPKRWYPVLILRHGYGEDETGWTRQGRAQWILDNLIAAGRARPMIIVMDRGYAKKPGMPPFTLTADTPHQNLRLGVSAFKDVVIHDL